MARKFLDVFAVLLLAFTIWILTRSDKPKVAPPVPVNPVTESEAPLKQPQRLASVPVGDTDPAPPVVALEPVRIGTQSTTEHASEWILIDSRSLELTSAKIMSARIPAGRYKAEIQAAQPVAAGFATEPEIRAAERSRGALAKFPRVDTNALECGAAPPAISLYCTLHADGFFFVQDKRGWAEYASAAIVVATESPKAKAGAIEAPFSKNLVTVRIYQHTP